MINKYAEIQDRILIYNACRGILRVKQAAIPWGSVAKALSKDKLPSMDLPVGEVILISTDGAEAVGLFPFFKYQKKKVVFGIPTSEELATFYERLEITP